MEEENVLVRHNFAGLLLEFLLCEAGDSVSDSQRRETAKPLTDYVDNLI